MIDHQNTEWAIKLKTQSDFDSSTNPDQFWFIKWLKICENNPNNSNTSLIAWTLSWHKKTLTCANN